jgi:ribosome production factor 2
VETDIVGDKVGRIHLGKQDLRELQTRKMKGLKRGRNTDDEGEGDGNVEDDGIISEDEDGIGGGVKIKRSKIV